MQGKISPSEELQEAQWAQYIFDIVLYFSSDDYLKEMFEFDAANFLKIMTRLFTGRPWKFFSSQKKMLGTELISAQTLLDTFKTTAKQTGKSRDVINTFYLFILQVANQSYNETQQQARERQQTTKRRRQKPFEMDYALFIEAFKNTVDVKSENHNLDEKVMLGALRSRELATDDINELFKLIQ